MPCSAVSDLRFPLLKLLIMPGGHSGEVIPVPIPNTEVKLSYADDTALQRESRKLPGFFILNYCSFVSLQSKLDSERSERTEGQVLLWAGK